MVAGALLVTIIIGLATFGTSELFEDDGWSFDDSDNDEVCAVPTINCSGGWQALALTVSQDIKSKIRRQNMILEAARKKVEESGLDVFEVPIPNAVSLEKDFFGFLEEVIQEMKEYVSNKKYDEMVIHFIRYIRNRIHKDVRLLNKTLHIELVGPDGLPTGLAPVVVLLEEHMQQRDDDMPIPF